MHLQAGEQGWLEAVSLLPDYAVVKSFHASMLREAKEAWIRSGRDPRKLRTCFRYGDRLVRAEWGTWEERKAHWRRQFAFFMDASIAPYLPYIDWVEECNEYTATSTWTSADDTRVCLGSAEAAVHIWNSEIRGKRYRTREGVILDVPNIQLVLCNGPVSNWIHRRYFELALQTDNRLGYHPYVKWWRRRTADGGWESGRDPTDWAEHSGLWHVMEQAHGLYPLWAFTESGPYQTAHWGWLHESVCGADLGLLVMAMGLWWADCARTRAYAEGRIDPGMWFTSGGVGWEFYQLRKAELIALATLARRVWKPGEANMDRLSPEKQAQVKVHLDAIWAIVTGQWWAGKPVPFKLQIPNREVEFLTKDGAPHNPPAKRNVTYHMDVSEVRGNLLRVWDKDEPALDWYVKAEDFQPL